jgi:hypothetical protein
MNAEYDDTLATRQRLYEQTKSELISKQIANSTVYDTSILTLSSAFLGLSIAFIKDIVSPLSTASNLPALYSSWGSFCIAIIVTIFSFMIGQRGYKKLLDGAERYYLKQEEDAFKISVTVSKQIEIANYLYGFFFVVGTILMLFFVITNFVRISNMPDPNTPKQTIEQRGQPTNTFQQLPAKPPASNTNTPQQSSNSQNTPSKPKEGS